MPIVSKPLTLGRNGKMAPGGEPIKIVANVITFEM